MPESPSAVTPVADELVLGLPRAVFADGCRWRGVSSADLAAGRRLLELHGSFRPRGEVEEDPSWKQVIPYVLLRDGDRLFLMRRTRAGRDQRLHDRYSLGIGGHVNPEDGGLEGGLRREWVEELDAPFEPTFRLLGLLNDETDPVGEVHLGFVYLVEADGRPVRVRETEKLEGSFATADEVLGVRDRLESWSRLLFDHIMG